MREKIGNLILDKVNFIFLVEYLNGDLNQEHKRDICSGNRYLGIIHTSVIFETM